MSAQHFKSLDLINQFLNQLIRGPEFLFTSKSIFKDVFIIILICQLDRSLENGHTKFISKNLSRYSTTKKRKKLVGLP